MLMAGRTHSKGTRRVETTGLKDLLVVDGDPASLPPLPSLPAALKRRRNEVNTWALILTVPLHAW